MTTVGSVYLALGKLAPFDTQCSWDNSGLIVGDASAKVEKALVALDVTPEVVAEAKQRGAQLIISHHPVIFEGERRFLSGMPAFQCAAAGIAVIACHTNFDAADTGVNRVLADSLGLTDCVPLTADPTEPNPIGLTGNLPAPTSSLELAWFIKARLGAAVRFTPGGGQPIARVAVCGGAGGDLAEAALATGAQALLSGEIKHHQMLEGQRLGLCMIEAGHYATEAIAMPRLRALLAEAVPEAEFFCTETVAVEFV